MYHEIEKKLCIVFILFYEPQWVTERLIFQERCNLISIYLFSNEAIGFIELWPRYCVFFGLHFPNHHKPSVYRLQGFYKDF